MQGYNSAMPVQRHPNLFHELPSSVVHILQPLARQCVDIAALARDSRAVISEIEDDDPDLASDCFASDNLVSGQAEALGALTKTFEASMHPLVSAAVVKGIVASVRRS